MRALPFVLVASAALATYEGLPLIAPLSNEVMAHVIGMPVVAVPKVPEQEALSVAPTPTTRRAP
jgi:hypothetical protein